MFRPPNALWARWPAPNKFQLPATILQGLRIRKMPAGLPTRQPEGLHQEPAPDLQVGLAYWRAIAQRDVTDNAVLGGHGNGSLPRIDALGSRLFLLTLMPDLSKISSPVPIASPKPVNREGDKFLRALEVGAGIGRVTESVLIHIFDRIDVLEPVPKFLAQAKVRIANCRRFRQPSAEIPQKSVRFWCQPIQTLDVNLAIQSCRLVESQKAAETIGPSDGWNQDFGYDVIWAQWTLGHLSDEELVAFLKRCKTSLKKPAADSPDAQQSFIVVKENIFQDSHDPNSDMVSFDAEDSSVTRSHTRFCKLFHQAGLKVVKQELQDGFDPILYPVKMALLG